MSENTFVARGGPLDFHFFLSCFFTKIGFELAIFQLACSEFIGLLSIGPLVTVVKICVILLRLLPSDIQAFPSRKIFHRTERP